MIKENQIKILHNFLAGVANRFGVLSIDKINISKIDSTFSALSEKEVLKAINNTQDRRFKVAENMIFTTQKKTEDLAIVLSSYLEFPEPEDIGFEDVKDWIDLDNLPSSKEFTSLKEYCINNSLLDDKVERAYRFNWTFYFSANGITMKDYDQLSPFVAEYFNIKNSEELNMLCKKALENQNSWMNAGQTSKQYLQGGSFSKISEKTGCNVVDIYNTHNFCLASANYYGYLELKDAFRIYKSINKQNNTLNRESFNAICEAASEYFSIYSISGAIASPLLFDIRILNYWHDKTKREFIAEHKEERTKEDAIYLTTLLLIKSQTGKKFSVPTENDFMNYKNDNYVKESKAYLKLIKILRENNISFDINKFNRNFNFYSNLVCENEIKRKSDAIVKLGLDKLENDKMKESIELLEEAFKYVPNWSLRGFSIKEQEK